jgi:hypothetical protein
VIITVSKLSSAKSRSWASPSRRSYSRPRSSARSRERQHLGAELDRCELHPRGIERQVASTADGDLQDLALGMGARPFPAAAEEDAIEEVHLAVVAARVLVLDLADALGLVCGGRHQLIAAVRYAGPSACVVRM